MTNYTTETYQTKRDILNFSKKISEGLTKSTKKFNSDMIYGILSSHSCLISEVTRSLKEKTKDAYVNDRLSTKLMNLTDEEINIIENNYYKNVMKYLPDDYVIVLNDDTDINKEYSNKLEDLCYVRDASSRVERIVNGYKVCEYVALGKNKKQPISLYSKLYSTISKNFISENTETINGEEKVIKVLNEYNRKPIFIRDRGYDSNEYLKKDIKEDNKFVTRLIGTRMLLFKDKLRKVLDVAVERKGKIATKLMYKGENKECSISYTRVKLPAYKSKEVSLVIIYGLSEEPMLLLTNLEVKDKESAEYIVRLYFLRWRIEEYFKTKKSYNWENSLVRSIYSMNNLNKLLTYSMFYLATIIEKLDTSFYSNIVLERAKSLKEKFIVYLSIISRGIKEVLKYARTGIKEWQNIKTREKFKQLKLNL